ncbi:unnamed protein product [Clavelina lepadiformis]
MDCHVNSPITNFTFDGLKSVQTIDLSLSNISTMEVGALDGLHNQQTLRLCDNPLKTLNALLFARETVPSISEIFLWEKHLDMRLQTEMAKTDAGIKLCNTRPTSNDLC